MARKVVSFDLSGVKEMDRLLRDLPKTSNRKVVTAALRKATVQEMAKRVRVEARKRGRGEQPYKRSPASKKYGPLSRNIRVRFASKVRSKIIFDVHSGNAFWAGFLEFGTSKMPPYPVFRPAFAKGAGPTIRRFGKEWGPAIEKETVRLARKYGVPPR